MFGSRLASAVDVGANKGQSVSLFLNVNPTCKIYAFEPNSKLFKKLESKYRKRPNIRLYNAGISDQSGEKLFQENILDYTSTFEDVDLNSKYLQNKSAILGVKPESLIKEKYIVTTITLSEFINKEIGEPIDIIKIDIEGHEYAALKGLFNHAINHPVHYIQIENHTDDMYLNKTSFEKIESLLNDNGFIQFAVINHGFGKIRDIIFKKNR